MFCSTQPLSYNLQTLPLDTLLTILSYCNNSVCVALHYTCRRLYNTISIRHYHPSILVEEVVRDGNVRVLQWLLDIDCQWNVHTITQDNRIITLATQTGNINLIAVTLSFIKYDYLPSLYSAAIQYGHIHILQHLLDCNIPLHNDCCLYAARYGRLECLQWLYQHGYTGNESMCMVAANGGHLTVLKWLRRHQCPWDSSTCIASAESGQLECLIYALENNCEWSELVCSIAHQRGYRDIVEYCVRYHLPGSEGYYNDGVDIDDMMVVCY